jgi:hypothetical protein
MATPDTRRRWRKEVGDYFKCPEKLEERGKE